MPDVRLPYEFPSPLRTARLLLRPLVIDDIDDVYAYQSLPEVCRYMSFVPRTRDEVAERIGEYSTARELASDGDYWQLAIERADEPGPVIGDIYFTIKSVADATFELGWTLHPDHTGSGHMTEAVTAVLEIAFGDLRLHRAVANIDPRNESSAALCARLGMRKEAHYVEDLWFKGAWADSVIYAILDHEWRVGAC